MQKRFSDPSKRLGARFAAKEAVMKSLGKGWREISWKEIEVTGGGKPTINTFGRASATVKEKILQIFIYHFHMRMKMQ